MFCSPGLFHIYMEERVKEALRKGEQERLRQVANPTRPRLLDRALASIGGLLLSAGKRLQARHAPVQTALAASPPPCKPMTKLY